MFKCAITGKMSKPGEKVNKIIVESRDKIYMGWIFNPETEKYDRGEVGRGWEIVKEISATAEGLDIWNKLSKENHK